MKAVVRDLQFHHDPVGESTVYWYCIPAQHLGRNITIALQSMVICKQPYIGGEGRPDHHS